MENILMLATLITPVTAAVVEIFKRAFGLDSRFAPLMSLVIGVVIGFVSVPFSDAALYARLWAGGLAGLSAMGLYDLAWKGRV